MTTSDWIASGIAVLSLLVSSAGLIYSHHAVTAANAAVEESRRSADAAERQAAAAEALIPPPAPPVTWKVRHVTGVLYQLFNTGRERATGLKAMGLPIDSSPLLRFPVEATAVDPGDAVEFKVLNAAQLPRLHSLALLWDGQVEPISIPFDE